MNIQDSLERLEELCNQFGWGGRDLKEGRNYRKGGQTFISIYSLGTDIPGTIEIGFEVKNLAKLAGRSNQEITCWIRELQTRIGSYAKPKTRYKYPRVALSTNHQVDKIINEISAYLKGEAKEKNEIDITSTLNKDETSEVDERILSTILSRRGQPKFRNKLLKAYNNKCAVTNCGTVAALEAAHIVPHSEDQSYNVNHGILLRADIHTLFDLHLLSINPETGSVVIAPECYPSYGEIAGTRVIFPSDPNEIPEPSVLMTHFKRWKARNGS